MLANDEDVRFDLSEKPEFDGFQWVSYWYPVNKVIDFKRDVYRRALKQLAPRLPVDHSLSGPGEQKSGQSPGQGPAQEAHSEVTTDSGPR